MYLPSKNILVNYANILVNFALGGGGGIKKGEIVHLVIPESAKPLMLEINKSIIKAGGHLILSYLPDETNRNNHSKDFYELASDDQLNFFPNKYKKGLIDQIDHTLFILAEADKHSLDGVDPKKIMQHQIANKPYMDWRNQKEHSGRYTWTIALYGTQSMADEAGLSLSDYWQQIIDACFLQEDDPILKWKQVVLEIDEIKSKLNNMPIDKLHIKGEDVDLNITMGEKRLWKGGGGRNIPSFEIFTSPDWRGTNGWIKFNQPLYRYGNLIDGIELEFKNGIVVSSKATKNEKVLKEMIATSNADKIGEFSLTDSRHSRITKFMAETLYDENMGGDQGNTHIALGMAYADCYDGQVSDLTKQQKDDLGFNDSVVHTDIISTTKRKVTATLTDGSQKVIYQDGKFVV